MALRRCTACAQRLTCSREGLYTKLHATSRSFDSPGGLNARQYASLSLTINSAMGKRPLPPKVSAPRRDSLGANLPTWKRRSAERKERQMKAWEKTRGEWNGTKRSSRALEPRFEDDRKLPPKRAGRLLVSSSSCSKGKARATKEQLKEAKDEASASKTLSSERSKSSLPPHKKKTTLLYGQDAESSRRTTRRLDAGEGASEQTAPIFRKTGSLEPSNTVIEKVQPLRSMDVPRLGHGLDRVLFNPGVYWLKDPRSGIYNFDPRIRNVLDVDLFDYETLPPYITSSHDQELAQLAKNHSAKFVGSTSSLTGLLSHCYFLLSAWRSPDLSGFSAGYECMPKGFSAGASLPASVKLVYKDGIYAVDSDKHASGEAENSNYVLTSLGKAMEKMLTTTPEDFERFTRLNSWKVTEKEKTHKESYHYAKTKKFLMRSQLDCQDERLPRKTFDLKTRAVVAVRQDRANWVESSGYQIRYNSGIVESFEREYYDMIRAALLKYNFQARIGHMDGIFVCYHNTATVFGFQYFSVEDMNARLFGSQEMADQSYHMSIELLEHIFESCIAIYPQQSLKLTVHALEDGAMKVFVEPDTGAQAVPDNVGDHVKDEISLLKVDVDRWLDGALVTGPVQFDALPGRKVREENEEMRKPRQSMTPVRWSVDYSIEKMDISSSTVRSQLQQVRERQASISGLIEPNVDAINERERYRETVLAQNPEALRRFLEDRQNGKAPGMPEAPGQIVGPVTEAARKIAAENVLSQAHDDGSEGDASTAAEPINKDTSKGETRDKEAYFRKLLEKRIWRLRRLAKLGAEDAATAAKVDPLKMYR
ncbi:Pet127-domain-containing protein, partial [Tilletiaria anomala UBC 951]